MCAHFSKINQLVSYAKCDLKKVNVIILPILTDCSIVYALEAASLHPALCLNIEKSKGTLNYGADADFLMLGRDLSIWSTWIAGECVYDTQR